MGEPVQRTNFDGAATAKRKGIGYVHVSRRLWRSENTMSIGRFLHAACASVSALLGSTPFAVVYPHGRVANLKTLQWMFLIDFQKAKGHRRPDATISSVGTERRSHAHADAMSGCPKASKGRDDACRRVGGAGIGEGRTAEHEMVIMPWR